MYKNARDLLKMAREQGKRVWEVALDEEVRLTAMPKEKVMEHFSNRLDIMFNSALKALEHRQKTKGALIDGVSSTQYKYSKGETLSKHCNQYLGINDGDEVNWKFIDAAYASVADYAIVQMQ